MRRAASGTGRSEVRRGSGHARDSASGGENSEKTAARKRTEPKKAAIFCVKGTRRKPAFRFIKTRKMKPKIVFLDEYSLGGADLPAIRALGDYTGYATTRREETAERCRDAEVAITNKVPMRRDTLERLPRLRLICVAATGMNHIDLEAAAERGIAVRNAVGYSTHSVTETTIGAAIALLRQTVYYDRYVKSEYAGSPLQYFFSDARPGNCTDRAGVSSGWETSAATWRGWPARWAAKWPTPPPRASCARRSTSPCRSTSLLGWADVVSIHAPLNERTRGLIGAREPGADETLGHTHQRRPRRHRGRGGAGRGARPRRAWPARGWMSSRTNRSKRAIPCSRSANRTGCCSRPTMPGRPSRRSACSWSASPGTSADFTASDSHGADGSNRPAHARPAAATGVRLPRRPRHPLHVVRTSGGPDLRNRPCATAAATARSTARTSFSATTRATGTTWYASTPNNGWRSATSNSGCTRASSFASEQRMERWLGLRPRIGLGIRADKRHGEPRAPVPRLPDARVAPLRLPPERQPRHGAA